MRVLMVEDHARLAATVASVLQREGMAVDVAFDGREALDRAALIDYDVVVLDRDLPGVHGDEVCRSLVTAGRSAVLMLSAAGSIEDRVEGGGWSPGACCAHSSGPTTRSGDSCPMPRTSCALR
jgi:DNA-binding response OmpR family regulator